MSKFERSFHAGWGDMDFNGHMRNTSYLDKCGDVRMQYFAAHGFPMTEFMRLGVGPVIMSDALEYHRELRLLEAMTVSMVACGMSDDGARFKLRNEFRREDGKKVAVVVSAGGWLNLKERKLMVPPAGLLAAMQQMERLEPFEKLPSL